MDRIKNGTHRNNILYTGSNKSFPIHYGVRGGIFLQRNLAYLYFTKCNEIGICHSDMLKNVSYKKKPA